VNGGLKEGERVRVTLPIINVFSEWLLRGERERVCHRAKETYYRGKRDLLHTHTHKDIYYILYIETESFPVA
jgi:hypothetical protein